jgi:hypothetical protein
MQVVPMRFALDTCERRYGFYGLSFFGDNDLSVEQIVALAGSRLEHLRVRVSTVGQLRACGLEPFRSGEFPHLSVRFEVSPSDEELVELAEAFDPAISNPGRAG